MNILIIGGTRFLGRHLVAAALGHGHRVTLFNRGRFAPPAGAAQITGDRNDDLKKLAGKEFDVCIDTCGYLPAHVRESASFLADKTRLYVFISSVSAYASFEKPDYDESAPFAELTAEQEQRVGELDPRANFTAAALGDAYGALKALCEREAENAMPGRVLKVRPGLIVGDHDWTDRFSYWVNRIARGGKVLAPGDPDGFIQFIDVRDIAEWTLNACENELTGPFNVTGRPFDLTFGAMLETIRETLRSDAEFVWCDDEFLRENDVSPWTDLPLFIDSADESLRGFLSANVDRAIARGLKFRALDDTVRSTFEWCRDRGISCGLNADREAELVEVFQRSS